MDTEKRKRDDGEGQVLEGKRTKVEEDHIQETVTEEEVEEFFTILRRIQVAAKHFGKTDVAGNKWTAASMKWRPCFQVQDFEEDNGNLIQYQKGEEEKAEEDSGPGLDLNSHPVSNEG